MIIPPPNRHSKTKARAKARARAKTKSKPSSKPQACPRPPSKSRPSAEPQTDATAPAAKEQLASALQLLHEIMQASGEQILLDPEVRPTAKMVYTNGVVLWMLIVQRLAGGKTLEEIVSQILTHDRRCYRTTTSPGKYALREFCSLLPGTKASLAGDARGLFGVRLQLPGRDQWAGDRFPTSLHPGWYHAHTSADAGPEKGLSASSQPIRGIGLAGRHVDGGP